MENLIEQLESYIVHSKKVNLSISTSPVEWHIDHTLKVINGISKNITASKEIDYKWKFNFARTLVLTLGTIPRGKAKAPKAVTAQIPITEVDLKSQLADAILIVQQLKNLKRKQNFIHPYFGMINTKQTIKFLKIHTNHHLKIIKDIVGKGE
jgi:hypothetical protein